MAAFSVRMAGLMCHVAVSDDDNEDKFRHVALLDEQTHHESPMIIIARSDLVVDPGAAFTHRLSKYEVVTFEGLDPGDATGDPRFLNGVPSLRTCINEEGDLDTSIKGGTRNNNVQAYVFYRKGALGVIRNFGKQARYVFKSNEVIPLQCIPSVVEFVAEDKGNNITVRVSRLESNGTVSNVLTRKVKSGGSVAITNLTKHAGAKHFEHYKRLTSAADVVVVDAPGTNCGVLSGGGSAGFFDALSGGHDDVKTILLGLYGVTNQARSAGQGRETTHPESERALFEAVGNKTTELIDPVVDPDPECSNSQWP